MKKLIAIISTLILLFAFASCGATTDNGKPQGGESSTVVTSESGESSTEVTSEGEVTPYEVKAGENNLMIHVIKAEDATLLEVMNKLQEDGLMTFDASAGFVASINGVEGSNEDHTFWALYTTDEDNSYASWGTTEFEGITDASAAFGAEALHVKDNTYYLWQISTWG